MRIGLISHTNFLGNSAMHVFSLARELQLLGHECAVLVPDSPETVYRHRSPPFPVLDYPAALSGTPLFGDGRAPDLLHAWTPRDHVREATMALVARFGCPYVVHMEDNERQIVIDEMHDWDFESLERLPEDIVAAILGPYRTHPVRGRRFLEDAAGYTCLIDRLLEFKPAAVPGLVFWAGYEQDFLDAEIDVAAERARRGIGPDELVLFYGGNVHASIARDVRSLYAAVLLLRGEGLPVRLLRTGWNFAPLGLDGAPGYTEAVTDLGFVDRVEMPKLVAIADMLVQPGRSDPFNDYRFPSKLPEYLASGRPVVLPDTNIGLHLEDDHHCLKLRHGTIREMAEAIRRLAEDPALRARLGAAGRAFAREHLGWPVAGRRLSDFYEQLAASDPSDRGTAPPAPAAVDAPPAATALPVRAVAFYLPQYHPIPENDRWWGKGFTEWTNVARARPQFAGHIQPRLPTDLGYYDLRVPEVLHEQAALARRHGLGGFCFYYYWFNGHRLLERPLDLWLAPDGPDFPFCICWANENWSRRWDGSEHDILMQQDYAPASIERFIRDVLPILRDPRYIRVDGAPMLLIYRVSELPDPVGTAALWRRIAASEGIETLHLVAVQSFDIRDPQRYGFDAAVEFSPPHIGRHLIDPAQVPGVSPGFKGYLEDYVAVAMESIHAPPTDYVRYRGCFPCWDNTPRRRERGHILINESPKAYAQWLRFLVREALARRDQAEPMVFINAWNEWAEGTYLEPDERYGHALLEATRAALVEGVVDHVRGPTPERERLFNEAVSVLPRREAGAA